MAIFNVISEKHETATYDPVLAPVLPEGKYDVMHVCFPDNVSFVTIVNEYKEKYLAENGLIIVHSTVAVGTCSSIGAVHSPVRGKHPNLTESIRVFTKYFGGVRAHEAAQIFIDLGVTCVVYDKAENTEAGKLWDTTIYGVNIIVAKYVKAYCDKHGLDFDAVYSHPNRSYNDGYMAMMMPRFAKYVLDPVDGPIGGHCVIPNAKLLESELAEWLVKENEKLS